MAKSQQTFSKIEKEMKMAT